MMYYYYALLGMRIPNSPFSVGGNKVRSAKQNTVGVKMDTITEEIAVSPMSGTVSLGGVVKGSELLNKFLHRLSLNFAPFFQLSLRNFTASRTNF